MAYKFPESIDDDEYQAISEVCFTETSIIYTILNVDSDLSEYVNTIEFDGILPENQRVYVEETLFDIVYNLLDGDC